MIETVKQWKRSLLSENVTLRETIETLNGTGLRVVFFKDSESRLCGILSDGDLRRGLLEGLVLDSPIKEIINRNPKICVEGSNLALVGKIMDQSFVAEIPVVNHNKQMVGLYIRNDLKKGEIKKHNHSMIIMAGGKGTRLLPHTKNCPKPMLELSGKPILEHIIERAKFQGFFKFFISLNYLGEVIKNYFGDGSALGVDIQYILETEPLGTAGALSLLDTKFDAPFVVTNGDILTEVNYKDLLDFGIQKSAAGVMAVRLFEWTNPFGVVSLDGEEIKGFIEKPVTTSYINAGIYAFEPEALDVLEHDQHCDMPTLFDKLRKREFTTVAYLTHEHWLDVGRPEDLQLAKSL